MIIAVASAYTAYQAKRTKDTAVQTLEVARVTEVNTNSMKDALVAATKTASHLEGRAELRKEFENDAAVVARNEKVTFQGAEKVIIEGKLEGKVK